MAQQLKPFRSLLEELYITQNVKIESIRDFMNVNHSINVGRCTYERLFKQWGFKKKNNGNDWAWVSHNMRKRQDAGRKSTLLIKNKPIPEETIRKEISRHVSTLQQSLHATGKAPSPPAPDGYAIVTPASSVAALTPPVPATPNSETQEQQDTVPLHMMQEIANHPPDAVYSNETHRLDDQPPTINLADKAMVVDVLESCGPFRLALGSSSMVLTPSHITQLYDYAAACIVVTGPPTKRFSVPPNVAPFAISFNVLLSAYREDVDFFRNFAKTSNPKDYSDVLCAAIFMAARKGALSLFETLFELVSKDVTNNKGQTCLHVASIHNHPRLAEFLIQQGVSVNARCRLGFTPWTAIGCLDSHEEVSQLLMAAGADINASLITDSHSLLIDAASNGKVEHVRTLIRRGTDLSCTTISGRTPLHVAKTLQVVKELVEAGANVNAYDSEGATPLDLHAYDDAKREYLVAAGAIRGSSARNSITNVFPVPMESMLWRL